jgi:ketosteroid isomerase-like protein
MSSTWEQDIRAREEENRVAFLKADVTTLARLWTDDFLVNSPLNLVNDKPRTLALLQAGRIRHSSLASDIERMTRYGDVVVVMGSDRVTDPPDGTITHRRFTNLWRLEGGAWRCFARHANAIRREPARQEAGNAA